MVTRRLIAAHECLSERGDVKLPGLLAAGDPRGEVRLAWHAKETLRGLGDIDCRSSPGDSTTAASSSASSSSSPTIPGATDNSLTSASSQHRQRRHLAREFIADSQRLRRRRGVAYRRPETR